MIICLKFDVAYKHNLAAKPSQDNLSKVDRIDWDLAFDIQKNDRTIVDFSQLSVPIRFLIVII